MPIKVGITGMVREGGRVQFMELQENWISIIATWKVLHGSEQLCNTLIKPCMATDIV